MAGSLRAGGLGPAGAEQMVPVGEPAGSWSCRIFCQYVGPPEDNSHIHARVTTHIQHTQEKELPSVCSILKFNGIALSLSQ